jgi:hypothetical protein
MASASYHKRGSCEIDFQEFSKKLTEHFNAYNKVKGVNLAQQQIQLCWIERKHAQQQHESVDKKHRDIIEVLRKLHEFVLDSFKKRCDIKMIWYNDDTFYLVYSNDKKFHL